MFQILLRCCDFFVIKMIFVLQTLKIIIYICTIILIGIILL